MATIKRFNKMKEVGEFDFTVEEIKDICNKYQSLKAGLLPYAIKKWNEEVEDSVFDYTDGFVIDWVDDFGDRGIGVEFLDQDGNDYNVTLTKEDLA
jgi:hypothetical protein